MNALFEQIEAESASFLQWCAQHPDVLAMARALDRHPQHAPHIEAEARKLVDADLAAAAAVSLVRRDASGHQTLMRNVNRAV